jgi:hypothetical protein
MGFFFLLDSRELFIFSSKLSSFFFCIIFSNYFSYEMFISKFIFHGGNNLWLQTRSLTFVFNDLRWELFVLLLLMKKNLKIKKGNQKWYFEKGQKKCNSRKKKGNKKDELWSTKHCKKITKIEQQKHYLKTR